MHVLNVTNQGSDVTILPQCRVCYCLIQAAVAGSRTVVGPGPSPPTITETETGGQIVRAGHKRFFFDLGSNAKGKFLRITEVHS